MTRPDERQAPLVAAVVLAPTLALDAAALATLRAWPQSLPAHLACYVGAGLAWLALLRVARRAPRGMIFAGLVAATLLQLVALAMPPRHSDDVYRYIWDGQVQRAGVNPYLFAPEDPALEALRARHAALYARVNNRQLPTIYPPAAQLAFAVSARLPLPPLAGWKVCVGLADGATALLLAIGAGPPAALVWLASPLVLVEMGVNAHVDALGIALLCAALLALHRRGRAGALLGLAVAVKLLPIYLVVALRDRRVIAGAALAIGITVLPFVGAGMHLGGSLGEYGRRWRSNDGAYALLYEGSRVLVAAAGKRAPTDETRLGAATRLVTGRDRDVAYPDELAGAAARLASFAIFVAVIVSVERRDRRTPLDQRARRLAADGVGAFLLLTPSYHPWYALWLLPPILLGMEASELRLTDLAWLWLAATAPLGHAPLIGYLATGDPAGHQWIDPISTRLVEHLPALLLCAVACCRARQLSANRARQLSANRARQLSSGKDVV